MLFDELYLTFYAAISAAAGVIASLASLMSLFRNQPSIANIMVFRSIIRYCAVLLVTALLPLLLVAGGSSTIDFFQNLLTPSTIWSICSLFYVILLTVLMVVEVYNTLHKGAHKNTKSLPYNQYMFWMAIASSTVVVVIVFINSFIWQDQFIVMVGLLWALAITALQLYMLLVGVTDGYVQVEEEKRRTADKLKQIRVTEAEIGNDAEGNMRRPLRKVQNTNVHETDIVQDEAFTNSDDDHAIYTYQGS